MSYRNENNLDTVFDRGQKRKLNIMCTSQNEKVKLNYTVKDRLVVLPDGGDAPLPYSTLFHNTPLRSSLIFSCKPRIATWFCTVLLDLDE